MKNTKKNLVLVIAVIITILSAFCASAAGISQKKITLTIGKKETLKVSGAKKVKWSSSDKKVASVSSKGVVKGVKAGNAKIVAKAGNKKYTCKVTVIAAKKAESKAAESKAAETKAAQTEAAESKAAQAKAAEAKAAESKAAEAKAAESKAAEAKAAENKAAEAKAAENKAAEAKAAENKDAQTKTAGTTVAGSAAETAKNTAAVVDLPMTAAEQKVFNIINQMRSRYPEGTAWGSRVFYEWDGGIFAGGLGCAAFVFMLSDEAFGQKPASIHENAERIMVGDCLRVNNDTHFVMVLKKTSAGVVVTEGNYGAKVHWGRMISWEELGKTLTYVVTRY